MATLIAMRIQDYYHCKIKGGGRKFGMGAKPQGSGDGSPPAGSRSGAPVGGLGDEVPRS